MIGRIASEDVGQARLDSNPYECKQPLVRPAVVLRELGLTQSHPGQRVGPFGMRL